MKTQEPSVDARELSRGISRRSFLATMGATGLFVAGAAMGCSPNEGDARGASDENVSGQEYKYYEFKQAEETREADLVVVGSGFGGMVTALTVAAEGYKVVVLEKMAAYGGNANHAEGMFGVGTKFTEAAGSKLDAVSLIRTELNFQNYCSNPKFWEMLVHSSSQDFAWILEQGVDFEAVLSIGGGEPTWHLFKKPNGSSAVKAFVSKAKELGIEMLLETDVKGVLMENGICKGVQAVNSDGKVIDFKSKATVIATGGMGEDIDGCSEFTYRDASRCVHRGAAGHNGDGIRIVAQAIEERPKDITLCLVGTHFKGAKQTTELGMVAGQEPTNLWVNHNGERFVDESVCMIYVKGSNAILTQKHTFSVFDQTSFDRFYTEGPLVGLGAYLKPGQPAVKIKDELEELKGNGSCFVADTLEDLAKQFEVDVNTFVKTVETYNQYCADGSDPAYLKDPKYLLALNKPPYYGFRLAPDIINTLGGIRIDEQGRVINRAHEPVVGLWAAGNDCSGFSGETYGLVLPGSTTGMSLFTGRLSGRSIVGYLA